MLLSPDEMRLDFGGAKLDPVRDRDVLQWMMSQFLYGEVTGIQVGHWLYAAPDLDSAKFLAKQAIEELQHVGNFVRVMELLSVTPSQAHPLVRFLATGMMGDSWEEHVAMEMAIGEGFVLMAFYALIDTLDHPEAVEILKRAARQEEGHVEFGEQRTMQLVASHPALRERILGLSLVWMWGVSQLASYIQKRLPKDHPVLSQVDRFLALALRCTELRLQRMGVLNGALADLNALAKGKLIAQAYAGKSLDGLRALIPGSTAKQRLTDTYLRDPALQARLAAPSQTP
jgi:hypothetical protein